MARRLSLSDTLFRGRVPVKYPPLRASSWAGLAVRDASGTCKTAATIAQTSSEISRNQCGQVSSLRNFPPRGRESGKYQPQHVPLIARPLLQRTVSNFRVDYCMGPDGPCESTGDCCTGTCVGGICGELLSNACPVCGCSPVGIPGPSAAHTLPPSTNRRL